MKNHPYSFLILALFMVTPAGASFSGDIDLNIATDVAGRFSVAGYKAAKATDIMTADEVESLRRGDAELQKMVDMLTKSGEEYKKEIKRIRRNERITHALCIVGSVGLICGGYAMLVNGLSGEVVIDIVGTEILTAGIVGFHYSIFKWEW